MATTIPSNQIGVFAAVNSCRSLRQAQGRLAEAVGWIGSALPFAVEHQMPVAGPIIGHLARILGEMGEEAFVAAWRAALPDEDELLASFLLHALAALEQQQDDGEE